MGNPACPAQEKQIKKVDVMLCTHGHFDHIGDAVEIAKGYNPTVGRESRAGEVDGKEGVKQARRDE